jgi:hypothetical protein
LEFKSEFLQKESYLEGIRRLERTIIPFYGKWKDKKNWFREKDHLQGHIEYTAASELTLFDPKIL